MNVYICSAARTAIGTYGGTLRDVHSSELGTAAAKAAIERAGVDKEAIDEVLFGQVLQGGVGQNVDKLLWIKNTVASQMSKPKPFKVKSPRNPWTVQM